MVWILAGIASAIAGASPVAPSLAGHRSLLPAEVAHPYVLNQFTFSQGARFAAVPDLTVEGYDESFDLMLLGIGEGLSVDARVADRWGLFAAADASLVTGLNADSAFFVGARAGADVEGGVTHVLWSRPDLGRQVAMRALVRGRRGSNVEPSGLVVALESDRDGTVREVLQGDYAKYLLTGERGVSGGAVVSVGQVLSPRVGLTFAVRGRGGPTTRTWFDGAETRSDTRSRFTGAVGAAVDRTGGKFGVALEARQRLDVDGDGDIEIEDHLQHRTFLGVSTFYLGRPDLDLGFQGSTLLQWRGVARERLVAGVFVLRVYL